MVVTVENLQHIAFIMDGNRRWAKKRGLPVAMGHKKGAEILIDTAKAVKNLGVKYMTVYAFSTENWQREKSEVDGLMNLLRNYLDNSFKELEENNVKIIFIGERNMLAADIVAKMVKIEEKTTPRTLLNFVSEWQKLGHNVKIIKPNFLLNSFVEVQDY